MKCTEEIALYTLGINTMHLVPLEDEKYPVNRKGQHSGGGELYTSCPYKRNVSMRLQ